jgi:hypothetical protein
MSSIILPSASQIYAQFEEIALKRQIVFLTGLPGTGKSLLIKQLVQLAHAHDRTVHLLQWDVTRAAFETAKLIAKYPEIDGVTHAAIRKAVGLWSRNAIVRWYERYGDRGDIILGEIPLIGNRLIELVRLHDDEAEPILAGEGTLFLVPVPSKDVRQVIEQARARSIKAPQHERETKDAPPLVLQMIWQDVAKLGGRLGLTKEQVDGQWDYDPSVYSGVYQHLLTHRHCQVLPIDTVLMPAGSAYDVDIQGEELSATADEVDAIIAEIEQRYTAEELQASVARWDET